MSQSRGALGLAAATYSAAGVGLLTSAVLTRAMDPADFGSYRFVIAVIGLTAIVTSFGLPYSAARALTQREPEQYPPVVAASLQLLFVAMAVGAVSLAAFSIATWSVLEVSHLLLLAAALLWTTALQRHFMYMLRGAGRPREIAVQTLLPPLVTVVLAALLATLLSRVQFQTMLLVTGFAYIVTHVWTASRFRIWGQRQLGDERAFLRQMQKATGLPIYQGSLVSVGVAELIVVFGGITVGTHAFGQFSLALSLAAPAATLPTVIGMVQFRTFGAGDRMPDRLLTLTACRSVLLGFVGIVVGWLTFPFVFPVDFEIARKMFPVLAAAYICHGLGDYLNQFLQAQGAGKAIRRAAYGIGAVNIFVGAFAIPFGGVWGIVGTKMVTSVAYMSAMLVLRRRWNYAGG